MATAGFAALWEGRPARPEELLPAAGPAAREAALALVGMGRAEIDGDGRLVGIHGLTLRPGRHHFSHAGRLHHTWCAFDSIGIPAAMGLDARARSNCPACGAGIEVALRQGEPEPGETVVWIPAPAVNHLMSEFCAAADLYCDLAHLEARINTGAGAGEVYGLTAAAQLGREAWADVRPPRGPASGRAAAGSR